MTRQRLIRNTGLGALLLVVAIGELQASSTLVAATGSGPFTSSDQGTTWQYIPVEAKNGLLAGQPNFTSMAIDPTNPSAWYAFGAAGGAPASSGPLMRERPGPPLPSSTSEHRPGREYSPLIRYRPMSSTSWQVLELPGSSPGPWIWVSPGATFGFRILPNSTHRIFPTGRRPLLSPPIRRHVGCCTLSHKPVYSRAPTLALRGRSRRTRLWG